MLTFYKHTYQSLDKQVTLYTLHTKERTYLKLVNKNEGVTTTIKPSFIQYVIHKYSLREVI